MHEFDIYVPNKNNYEDCLYVIGIGLLNKPRQLYVLKEIPFWNKKKLYHYTHIFHNYFTLRTAKYIKYDPENHDDFLFEIYDNIDTREKLFTQEKQYKNKILLNRHHEKYIRKYCPQIKLDFSRLEILMAVLKEVNLVNMDEFENNYTDISDRIGVCVSFDNFDAIPPDNKYVLNYLKTVKNEKLYVVSDELESLPKIDSSNDVMYFPVNILRVFGKQSSIEENYQILKNILQAGYNLAHTKECHGTNSDFCTIFLNFMRIKFNNNRVKTK